MGIFRRTPRPSDEADFKQLAAERRKTEDDVAWFEGEDDGPDLDIETGIGSNLRDDPRD